MKTMIHYGKEPSGDLEIRVPASEVGEVYDMLESAGLLQRRTFDDLKRYIESEFGDELAAYHRRREEQKAGLAVKQNKQTMV